MPRTITSANSELVLTVPGVLAAARIEGYAADDQFSSEAVDVAETMMGVDGKMSAGWVPYITPMTVTLQADSESADLFDLWLAAQKALREVIYATAIITIPSIGKTYVLSQGALKNIKQFPDGKRTLQPVAYQIHWGKIDVLPIAAP